MSLSDVLGDTLTRIRNAQAVKQRFVIVYSSKQNERVLSVLVDEGYIKGFEKVIVKKNKHVSFDMIKVFLSYYNAQPVIKHISRVSKPGCRVYSSYKELTPFRNGFGVLILTTPQGIITDVTARKLSVGGEVLCKVF